MEDVADARRILSMNVEEPKKDKRGGEESNGKKWNNSNEKTIRDKIETQDILRRGIKIML